MAVIPCRTSSALDQVIADHRDAELMVISGDLSGIGELADYHLPRERLNGFPIPVRPCIGNHDHSERCLSVFPKCADADGFAQGVHDTSFGRCLLLDTYDLQTAAGSFCPARPAWLERQLSEHDGPFFLVMHHNLFPTRIAPVDRIGLLDDAGSDRSSRSNGARSGTSSSVTATSCRAVRCGRSHDPRCAEPRQLSSIRRGADRRRIAGVLRTAFVGDDYVTVHMVEFGYRGEIIREDRSS
ncbi:Icc protein [Bradyrhizobium sp. USDA 4520]